MKPHKHAELIKAWADGAEIEALFFNDARDNWTIVQNPAWSNVSLRFRIKPEPNYSIQLRDKDETIRQQQAEIEALKAKYEDDYAKAFERGYAIGLSHGKDLVNNG